MKWGASLRVLRRFAPSLRDHRGALLGVVALAIAVVGLELMRPWAIAWVFDEALAPALADGESGPRYEPGFVIWTGALGLFVIVALRVGAEYAGQVSTVAVGHAVTRSLRHRIFEHLVRLAPGFHQRNKSGDLLVRLMGDVPMLRTMLVDSTVELASRVLLIVGTLAVMFWRDALLTAALCVLVPIFGLVVHLISGRITIAVRKQRRKEGELADYLHEALEGTEALQALGRSEDVVRQFARSNRRSVRAGMKAARLAARLSASVELMISAALATCLVLGAFRVVSADLSAGELLVFLSYVRGLFKPVRSATKHAERIAKGTACGERISAVLDERVDVTDEPGARTAPSRVESLEFEGIAHEYTAGVSALEDVHARFVPGEVCGLFGPSGAGKSTLAALAVRLFDPSRGRVLLNGIDVRTLKVQSLRDRVGFCMQESVLFGETVRQNLELGKPEASEDEMWSALEGAGAAGVVRAQPDGLDTVLGARGSGLSGGERRRLVLARTILRDAPVVIVDEPFTGLDMETADHVRRTLTELARERIVIVISHEREELPFFDRVVELRDGRVLPRAAKSEVRT